MDNRAVTPVVEKLITMGLVVLFVGGLTTTLYGTAVPAYRGAVGDELGDRVLATAVREVETAVPPDARSVSARTRVDLPATIAGTDYEIHVDGRSLVLDHPDPAVGGRARLALPEAVASVSGSWESGAATVVRAHSTDDGIAVVLGEATDA